MGEPRDIFDCRSHEELLALWQARYERIREMHERWADEGLDLSRFTRPPRDPDERAYLAQHGGLGPFTEKPNPPWAKGWPPRNPNRPLTEREKFADAVNAAWREEPMDDERPIPDAAVPQPDTESARDEARAPATRDGTAGSGAVSTP